MSGSHSVSRDSAADSTGTHSGPGRLTAVLLLIVGCSLVAAGGLLWSRYGAAVLINNPVLAALAWCFDRSAGP
jgi:hypothetical protein